MSRPIFVDVSCRIGGFLIVRDLLMSGLECESSIRMPHLFTAVSVAAAASDGDGYSNATSALDASASHVGLRASCVDSALAEMVAAEEEREFGWRRPEELEVLAEATAAAVAEGAAGFKSSVFVAETTLDGTEQQQLSSSNNSSSTSSNKKENSNNSSIFFCGDAPQDKKCLVRYCTLNVLLFLFHFHSAASGPKRGRKKGEE